MTRCRHCNRHRQYCLVDGGLCATCTAIAKADRAARRRCNHSRACGQPVVKGYKTCAKHLATNRAAVERYLARKRGEPVADAGQCRACGGVGYRLTDTSGVLMPREYIVATDLYWCRPCRGTGRILTPAATTETPWRDAAAEVRAA